MGPFVSFRYFLRNIRIVLTVRNSLRSQRPRDIQITFGNLVKQIAVRAERGRQSSIFRTRRVIGILEEYLERTLRALMSLRVKSFY